MTYTVSGGMLNPTHSLTDYSCIAFDAVVVYRTKIGKNSILSQNF